MFSQKQVKQFLGILAILISFVIMIFFNALAGSGQSDIFVSTVGNLSDKYDLDITPSGFTFLIWSVIYIWLGLTIVLQCVSIKICPQIGTSWYCYFLVTNFLYNTAWIFTWDREKLVASAVLLFLGLNHLPLCWQISIKTKQSLFI